MNKIEVAAVLFRRKIGDNYKLLFVKAYGRTVYVFPGGKIDKGETPEQAIFRELDEEIQTSVTHLTKLAVEKDSAPDGRPMTMYLFSGQLSGEPRVANEIESMAWMSLDEIQQHDNEMTDMTRRCLPHIRTFLSGV